MVEDSGTSDTPQINLRPSFFVHHTQRLSKAAACGDINGIPLIDPAGRSKPPTAA